MHWRKLGLLYVPDGRQAWARTHAMLPTPVSTSETVVRLYVAHLDDRSVGRVGYLDISLADPLRPTAVGAQPVLDIGAPGSFDDNGVVPSCVVTVEGRLNMYYSGYQLQTKIPYTIFSSLAVGDDAGRTFSRLSRAPLLDRTDENLFFRAAPFVLRVDGTWRMWYIGGSAWTADDHSKLLPSYSLWHTNSRDGIIWCNPSVECLVPQGPEEIGFGRPFILRHNGKYRMWYSIRRRQGYRLGYAESADGLGWTRRDALVGIGCSATGWDSEMICYAVVVPTKDRWLMFYNGNGYGRTGVGVAVAEPEQ
jgi:predicted GH43/DUF377 family glycosyl hydrolase